MLAFVSTTMPMRHSHSSLAILQIAKTKLRNHRSATHNKRSVIAQASTSYRLLSSNSTTQQQREGRTIQQQKKHVNALILGKPGGGKGTISNKILADFPIFHHLSTGDVLRQHVRNGTTLGKEAKTFMDNGELVPDDLMIRLVLQDVSNTTTTNGEDRGSLKGKRPGGASNQSLSLLLDGFPRTIEQGIALEGELHIDIVINLDIPTETIVERIADRWLHPASGRIYSYFYHPPKKEGIDDETGEALIQRDDDKPQHVRTRLAKYDEVTVPLIEFYQKKGVLQTFHGTKSDVIYVDVKQWINERLQSLHLC